MPDVLTPQQRSHCMSRIRGKHTKPEMLVRKGLFALGFRYKIHDPNLPGSPDLVFPKYRAVVFVHGCLWHRHQCRAFKWPATNAEFWRKKITRNAERDERNVGLLRSQGWRVLTIWECALKGRTALNYPKHLTVISRWLVSGRTARRI